VLEFFFCRQICVFSDLFPDILDDIGPGAGIFLSFLALEFFSRELYLFFVFIPDTLDRLRFGPRFSLLLQALESFFDISHLRLNYNSWL